MIRKTCLASNREFTVRDKDIEFLGKVSPIIGGKTFLIPQPKLCPEERMKRRLAYRNERNLYKRKSALSGTDMVSCFASDSPYTVYTHDEWWSDKWDASSYGRDFDFSRGFFEQFYDLELRVPRTPLINNRAFNSDYCNFADGNKNCYLLTSANDNEDCFYGSLMAKNRSIVDVLWCFDNELCYEAVECYGCYNVRFSQQCERCVDSSFLYNCRSVKNSLLCVNLEQKQYYILNQPSTKEVYEKTMKEIEGSHEKYRQYLKQFEELKKEFQVRRASHIISSEDCVGDNIFQSKNIYMGFDVYTSRDCAYLHDGLNSSDCMDVAYFDKCELCYESNSLMGYGYRFTNFCRDSANIFYCDNCHSCKNCFGCVGLRNKEYCIFNKQYTKEQYEKLVPRIIEHMRKQDEWGEFFPIKYSMFPYNESVAHEFFPMKKEQAVSMGFPWRDITSSSGLTLSRSIPDNIRMVSDSICNEVLTCEKSGRKFRVIPQELEFYRNMSLPLPRICPDERHMQRVALRNPFKTWERNCGKCGKQVASTYSSSRAEVIYCENCFRKEIF